jgi:hypothetical protein
MAPSAKDAVQLAVKDLDESIGFADKAYRSDFMAAHIARLPKRGEKLITTRFSR